MEAVPESLFTARLLSSEQEWQGERVETSYFPEWVLKNTMLNSDKGCDTVGHNWDGRVGLSNASSANSLGITGQCFPSVSIYFQRDELGNPESPPLL